MKNKIASLIAIIAVTLGLAACYPMHPERCNKAIIVIDGQSYVSCQSGLRPLHTFKEVRR